MKKVVHMKPIICSLHWLPIQQRIEYKIILITYKALNGQGPHYIKDLLTFKAPKSGRSSRAVTNKELCIPKTKRAMFGDRCFKVIAPKLWNKLPIESRNVTSLSTFKTVLKTHLFKAGFAALL